MGTLRSYKRLRARKQLNRVSPKKFEKRGEWHPQVTKLEGVELQALYDRVFNRSGGLCECGKLKNPPMQCPVRVSRYRDDPHHIKHRSKGGGDTEDNVIWVSRDHHIGQKDSLHPGPQWGKSA